MTHDATRLKTEHLRLRSALFDRVTGLPALPMLFDDMRALLDARRVIGFLHFAIPNLTFVEGVYGWQTFDRIMHEQAETLDRMRGRELPDGTRLAQSGIHGESMIAVLPQKPDGGEVETEFLIEVAGMLERALQKVFGSGDFATIVPRLEPRVGFALLSENPFYRFERVVYRAIDEARLRSEKRDERRRRSWGDELQTLIREGRIVAHFQPVVDLETLEIIGYEALSRGLEGSGFESPAVMFAHSKEAGLSADLDRLCRRTALASARGIGVKRKIFLNTLVDHLSDPDWQNGGMEETLAGIGLMPDDLVVEFAETGARTDDAALERSVALLKQRGFKLAIDNIGTGYAGLRAIERLRPDFIKIDMSLVRHIESSLIQQDLLGSLVAISGRLGSSVIAEGIESRDELVFLRTHGAQYGQGFLFAGAEPVMLPGPIVLGRDH